MSLVDEIAERIADRHRTTGTAGGLLWGSNMRGVLLALAPVALAMLGRRRDGEAPRGDAAPQQSDDAGIAGSIVGRLLEGSRGPFAALLERLERAGYAEQTRTWVAHGANQPLPSEAVERTFGSDGVSAVAQATGVAEGDVSRGLAELLPELVDRVTPDGRLPDDATLRSNVDELARRLDPA